HPIDFGQLVAGDAVPTWQYLASENGRHLYVRVAPVLEADAISAADDAIVATRRVLAEVKARHPDIVAGLTGVEVVEADETSVAIVDSTWASVVATVLITLLLVLAFHSWRIPVLAMAALLLGIAWSFGYVTLAIGH